MRPKVACERCFQDKRLKQFIRETGSKSSCPWCGAKNTYVLALEELGPLFREVAKIYNQVEGPEEFGIGDSIGFLLQEHWGIFSDRIENAPNDLINAMAIAILKAGLHPKHDVDEPDYDGLFKRKEEWLEGNWHEKIEQLMTK